MAATLDTNTDGKLDTNDTTWSKLKVWQDTDGDGLVDSGELATATSLGISEISLATTSV